MHSAAPKRKKTDQVIRDVSTKLFVQNGYAAVSMRMIADAVGVQVSALYNHYPSKQTILVDLLTSHMDALLAAWAEQFGGRKAKLEDFARFHIRYHITKPDQVFLSYMELRALEPENFAALEKLRSQYETILVDILKGVAPEEPKIAALAILGMLTGATTWYRPEGRLSATEIEQIYVRMALGCVGLIAKEAENV